MFSHVVVVPQFVPIRYALSSTQLTSYGTGTYIKLATFPLSASCSWTDRERRELSLAAVTAKKLSEFSRDRGITE